jgi:hypothetical protein
VAWAFGEPPLAETTELAAALRRVTAAALALESPNPVVRDLIDRLTAAERALAADVAPEPVPRVGPDVDRAGRVYLDHGTDIWAYHPAFPAYEIEVDGDRATGEVAFPIVYEGPPGLVHGGFLALFFDTIVQHHNCEIGSTGKTIRLDVQYRRPTPLLTPLQFEVHRTRHDDRIESTAVLSRDGKPCAEARMQTIASDRASLPAVDPRRSTP